MPPKENKPLETTSREMTVVEWSAKLRKDMKATEAEMRSFIAKVKRTDEIGDREECIGQATLALRYLESSRMRIGKVIQYAVDGISCYDKGETSGESEKASR